MVKVQIICFVNLFAVCLDGSLPGYHLQKGFGSGSDKWVLHIEVSFYLLLTELINC